MKKMKKKFVLSVLPYVKHVKQVIIIVHPVINKIIGFWLIIYVYAELDFMKIYRANSVNFVKKDAKCAKPYLIIV